MFEWVTEHQSWIAVAVYWIFSAAVSSMPGPASNGSPGYRWVYRFLHTMAGNVPTAFGSKIKLPGAVLGVICTLSLLIPISACAARYTAHPGALNQTDSVAYDALLIAQTAIDHARTAYTDGRLSVGEKEPLNTLIRSYNVARDSWLLYRGAIATSTPPDTYFNQLAKNISALTSALRAFKEAQ